MPTSTGRKQKTARGNRTEKPIPFQMGAFTGKIYRSNRFIDGTTYQIFRPSYWQPDGRRVLRDAGSLERAQEILTEAARAFGQHRPDVLEISAKDRRDFDGAMDILRPIGLSLFEAANSITSALANEFAEAGEGLHQASLIYLGLVLFFITFVVLALSKLLLSQLRKGEGTRA